MYINLLDINTLSARWEGSAFTSEAAYRL